jgi:acyl-CoA dehydrogenase
MMDDLIAQTAERIFADHSGEPQKLWQALVDNGLVSGWTHTPDSATDLSLVDGFGLMRIAAASNTAVPFSQTLLASWVLGRCGIEAPAGQGAIVQCDDNLSTGDAISASFNGVEFGAQLDWLACHTGDQLVLLPAPAQASAVNALADDTRANLDYQNVAVMARSTAPGWLDHDALELLLALMRSAQLCGAMEAALDIAIDFTAQREQFGRSLAKFQAIQHMLSEMAGELSASIAALDAAAELVGEQGADLLSAASAKARASEAASIVGAHAHQVHGAIGYTREYALAHWTSRLWRWRDDCGDETFWAAKIGNCIAASQASLGEIVFGRTQA